ncbi:SufD family Fe-S cluster assembly protein [Candidatus Parcubacteria bacterium]|jgi:Fe-S cluster assembly protein SufD|nr:MAG: SufD family Fe-S cluster assembly protein [Candidatus Parcubacteria bacterium]
MPSLTQKFFESLADLPKSQKQIHLNRADKPTRILERTSGWQSFRLELAPGAKAEVLILGEFQKAKTRNFLDLQINLQAEAELNLVENLFGGKEIGTRITINFLAPGASCLVTGLYRGENQARQACEIVMHHRAPNTTGNVLVKGVYQGQASGAFAGLIKTEKHAQKTQSYYRDEVLLLDQAQALSNPTLEISANDVKASHGSVTSQINAEQVFYLQSRGLNQIDAKNLLIVGFLTPALNRLPKAFCQKFLPK